MNYNGINDNGDIKRKKKIAFYINVLTKGGAERVMSQLANQFAEHGYNVFLISSFQSEGEYILSPKVQRINLENKQDFGNKLRRNIKLICELRSVLKKIKPDVLVSFMQEPNFRAVIATRGLNIRTIVSVRNDPNMEYAGKVGNFVGKIVLPLADGCVFQTEDARQWFPKKIQKKSKIIFNEVSQKFFTQKWRPESQIIVSVGRLSEQKNQKMLINAFVEVAPDFPDCTLEIYGDGPLKNDLQKQINKTKFSDRIFLKGNVDEVEKVLSRASIFILSSDYEGMPNALLEALAIGVPCISTDCPCGGPRMIIRNKVNGILVPVSNYVYLSRSIRYLLDSPDKMEEISINAKKTAVKFDPLNIFKEWEEYIIKTER